MSRVRLVVAELEYVPNKMAQSDVISLRKSAHDKVTSSRNLLLEIFGEQRDHGNYTVATRVLYLDTLDS